jgi:hypothetical protein
MQIEKCKMSEEEHFYFKPIIIVIPPAVEQVFNFDFFIFHCLLKIPENFEQIPF